MLLDKTTAGYHRMHEDLDMKKLEIIIFPTNPKEYYAQMEQLITYEEESFETQITPKPKLKRNLKDQSLQLSSSQSTKKSLAIDKISKQNMDFKVPSVLFIDTSLQTFQWSHAFKSSQPKIGKKRIGIEKTKMKENVQQVQPQTKKLETSQFSLLNDFISNIQMAFQKEQREEIQQNENQASQNMKTVQINFNVHSITEYIFMEYDKYVQPNSNFHINLKWCCFSPVALKFFVNLIMTKARQSGLGAIIKNYNFQGIYPYREVTVMYYKQIQEHFHSNFSNMYIIANKTKDSAIYLSHSGKSMLEFSFQVDIKQKLKMLKCCIYGQDEHSLQKRLIALDIIYDCYYKSKEQRQQTIK